MPSSAHGGQLREKQALTANVTRETTPERLIESAHVWSAAMDEEKRVRDAFPCENFIHKKQEKKTANYQCPLSATVSLRGSRPPPPEEEAAQMELKVSSLRTHMYGDEFSASWNTIQRFLEFSPWRISRS